MDPPHATAHTADNNTASKSSQTDSVAMRGSANRSIPKLPCFSQDVGFKGKHERFEPTRSRLLGPLGVTPTDNNRAKRRRTTPSSNWECDPAPIIPTPTEFDLGNFAFTALPNPHEDLNRFNDDLVIEHYQPAPRSFSGTQRKGIVEPFCEADSYDAHILAALNATFPMSDPTPLPIDLRNALYFNRDNSMGKIAEFRSSQLKKLRVIADECRDETEERFQFAPDPIKSSQGKPHIALLAHLARFTRMRGTNWLMQFATGFPITGRLSQSGVFPIVNAPTQEILHPDQLFETKAARFKARAPRANSRSSQTLWGEALEQVQKGRLYPPQEP